MAKDLTEIIRKNNKREWTAREKGVFPFKMFEVCLKIPTYR
jgi:hypothetical protein